MPTNLSTKQLQTYTPGVTQLDHHTTPTTQIATKATSHVQLAPRPFITERKTPEKTMAPGLTSGIPMAFFGVLEIGWLHQYLYSYLVSLQPPCGVCNFSPPIASP